MKKLNEDLDSANHKFFRDSLYPVVKSSVGTTQYLLFSEAVYGVVHSLVSNSVKIKTTPRRTK